MLKSTFSHTHKEFPRQFICGCELENNLVSLVEAQGLLF